MSIGSQGCGFCLTQRLVMDVPYNVQSNAMDSVLKGAMRGEGDSTYEGNNELQFNR